MNNLMKLISFFVLGGLFGAGLSWSSMLNPAKVLAFLDIFGAWDPSLILVMVGGVFVAAVGYAATKRMKHPLFAKHFPKFEKTQIDKNLVLGAILFGIGWGLIGLCPGPAVCSLIYLKQESIIFFVSMLAGIGIVKASRLL